MKTTFNLLLGLIWSTSVIFSQKPISVVDDSIVFSSNRHPGFVTNIPEVSFESVQKNWIKALQKGTKSEVTINAGEISIFGANIKDFSETPVNVFSKFLNMDTLVKLMVIVELQKDKYLERASGENEMVRAKNYLRQFAKEQYLDLSQDQLKVEDKKLNELKSELKSLQKDKLKLQESIQESNKDISAAKENIQIKNNELISLSAEIVTQNGQLNAMQDGEVKKQKAEYIKDLEKQKKKILNSIESSEKNINNANTKISNANADIPKNESNQADVRTKIDTQEKVLRRFSEKLATIKKY